MKKIILVLMMALVFAVPARAMTLYALNVGKGDALILRASDGSTALIDCGKSKSFDIVKGALEALGVDALDAVILTHTDKDHAGGLSKLAKSDIPVGAWYASAYSTGVKEGKHPAEKAAKKRDAEVISLQRGDAIALGDITLRVLMPDRLFTDKDDNNSLVMMAESPDGRILLTGDMELPEEAALLALRDDLRCDVLKLPNHGDNDTSSMAFLQATGAKVGIISTNGEEKPDTPDPALLKRMASIGMETYITEDAPLWIAVTLDNGAVSVDLN